MRTHWSSHRVSGHFFHSQLKLPAKVTGDREIILTGCLRNYLKYTECPKIYRKSVLHLLKYT